jgi:hypothetical protein
LKNPDKRKKLIFILAIITVSAIFGSAAFSFFAYLSSYDIPSPKVEALTAYPDFSAVIKWNKVPGAEYYVLEYKYDYVLYRAETHVVKTANNYRVVERVKGILSFRVKAVLRKSESEFSDWKEYVIPPLTLDTPEPFRIAQYKKGEQIEIRMLIDTWNPVTYYYRNKEGVVKEGYVNYYEFFIVAPGQDKDTMMLHPKKVMNAMDLKTFDFGFGNGESGEWKIYYRATTYDYVIYEQGEYGDRIIDIMYAPSDNWAEVFYTIMPQT